MHLKIYNNNMDEKNIIQNRITNLISLRQTMIQSLVVLIGGTAGICFIPDSIIKFIMMFLGLVGIVILAKTIIEYKKELAEYLYKNKEGKL